MFRFRPHYSYSRESILPPVKRLGKVDWLGIAFDEGWLERIELRNDDGDQSLLVAKWDEPAARIPLFIRMAPQIDDKAMRRLLRLRQLMGIKLPSHALRNPVVTTLARCRKLRELNVEFRLVESGIVNAVVEQIVRLPRLRRLCLEGHHLRDYGDRPNDADLLRFREALALKRLYLPHSPAVTEAAIDELHRARPGLMVKRSLPPHLLLM